MTTKQINGLLILAGLAWFLLRGRPMTDNIAGVPIENLPDFPGGRDWDGTIIWN